ncbi:zinc carboxypeptidase [Amyelois transitella]|uniref:zinc carboxypeptidase n=1 Tax=Amyelois transitella TaxID=680683 RepID=UPI0029907950|nr:zinc carboxypeptidase [Amyelois transitella]
MLQKIVFLSVLAIVLAQKVRYDDYTLYKVIPRDENGLLYLKKLYKTPGGLTFWSVPNLIGNDVSVLASPDAKKDFENSLEERNVQIEVLSRNIQEDLDAETTNRHKRSTNRNEIFFDEFNTVEDINNYFEFLADSYDFVSTFVVGSSFEGRNITGLRISKGISRRVFILQGGEVGADWLSPTLVAYLADQLVKGEDPEALAASQDFEWHIIPVVNPDGFEYSQNHDRLWVKNRRIDNRNPTGVDLVRNWNSHWGIYGGSFVNTDVNYIGLGPFSEPETRSVSNYILSLAPRITGLLSFRSFGQRFLIPFAQTDDPFYNYNEMVTISRRSLGSLAVKYNTQYLAGTSRLVGDGSTGTIGDWVKYRFNPPIVGTYLLRGASYFLPIAQVLPSCEETFDSVMAIFREARFIDVL